MGHGQKAMTAAAALVACVALAVAAGAGESTGSGSSGRGWVFGGTIGGGRETFAGAEGLVLAIGSGVSREIVDYGTPMVIDTREAAVVPAGVALPEGTVDVVPFPTAETQLSFSFHGGYAFSRRVALLLDVQMDGGLTETSFDQLLGGFAIRYSPVRRLWVQAGPGRGMLWAHYDGAKTPDMRSGFGILASAGYVVLQKASWGLDVEVRYARVPQDGFTTSRLHFAVGASKRRS